MNTKVRTKITTICETVTANFFYQYAPKGQALPYGVYQFFAQDEEDGDTKKDHYQYWFQITSYQRTDGLVETLATSFETAILAADFNTTSYRCISKKKTRRVAVPVQVGEIPKRKALITEFHLIYELL